MLNMVVIKWILLKKWTRKVNDNIDSYANYPNKAWKPEKKSRSIYQGNTVTNIWTLNAKAKIKWKKD